MRIGLLGTAPTFLGVVEGQDERAITIGMSDHPHLLSVDIRQDIAYQDLSRRPDHPHPALFEQNQSIGVCCCQIQVVKNRQDDRPLIGG